MSECDQPDPIGAIDELPAIADLVDALAAASDSQLALVLEELDSVVGTNDQEQAFSDFAGAQPGAEQLVGDVAGLGVPALGQVPIVSPSGSTIVDVGAPPEQGGASPAGSAAYVLHAPVPYALGVPDAIATSRLTGPNPPFVALRGYEVVTDPGGHRQVYALVEINPAQAGTFHATITAHVVVLITGVGTSVDVSVPLTVIVQ